MVTALIVGLLALLFSLATYIFSDDHFGRISPGRQISRYGELPFRDFFDPGYFLTEFSSAAMQRLLGDNLLGEMLLTSSFVAGGAVAILLLVRRAGGSLPLAVVTAVAAVLSFRRPYDYDKFLFYPLGLLACWRYADTRRVRDLVLIAGFAVVAGLFRYDNGVFIVSSALVGIAATHARERSVLVRRLAMFGAASVVAMLPYAVFLQLNGGLVDGLDQMATYARTEGTRTRVATLPSGLLSEVRITPLPPPPPNRVQIRWTTAADQNRAVLESRYSLHDGVPEGDPGDRIWRYEIENISRDNLRALVNDPAVADTALLDRVTLTLKPQESLSRRLRRHIPFFGANSVSWTPEGAAKVIYYVVLAISVVAVVLVARSTSVALPGDRARVLSAATMSLLAVALVMRDPIVARIGGVIGPPAVLAAWLWHRGSRRRLIRVVAAVCVLATLAVATEWQWSINRLTRRVRLFETVVAAAVATPPPTSELPKPHLAGIVDYLRRCTSPNDRVFAAWFVPELYYFSERGFAGGMVETFGVHWSEVGHQRRVVAKMRSESVPVVIFLRDSRADFRRTYPMVDEYLTANYEDAGSLTFGDTDGTLYTVLTQRGRPRSGEDPQFSIPCFASQR